MPPDAQTPRRQPAAKPAAADFAFDSPAPPAAPPPPLPHKLRAMADSKQSRAVYMLFGLALGPLGFHNFYCGRASLGLMQLGGTAASLALWLLVFRAYGFGDLKLAAMPPAAVAGVWVWAVLETALRHTDRDGRTMQ